MKYEYVHSFTSEDRTERDDEPTYRIGRPTKGLLPVEFLDVEKVFQSVIDDGKYKAHDWEYGVKFDAMKNYDSMFHHLCEARAGQVRDSETGLHPLLHLATRALMAYTLERRERNEALEEYLNESARQQQMYYLDHDEPYCDIEMDRPSDYVNAREDL